ncbi:MAG TPA: DUF4258 domain-containing protein [Kofleriaceae bacterium]|nr:DUF4258 domain-containing protein [Kofleriaceae bacterium]
MTDAEALALIRRMVRRGDVVFTRHAQDRMDERGASTDDVCNALVTARTAAHEPDRDRWKVSGGTDLDGDALQVVVAIEADVIVVTLF